MNRRVKRGEGGRSRAAGAGDAYARAGVDIALGNAVKGTIQGRVRSTHGPRVLGKIGGFGGLFRASFDGVREPVLVASIDGVGTKLKIAAATGEHRTVGRDLVHHCVDDIATLGARPLFFLDYIGTGRLDPGVFDDLIAGLARGCRDTGCALIGGETAQMPGMYGDGEYDLVGTIIGVVGRRAMWDGSRIRPGDAIVGLASNGLHTNGYSLARRVLLEEMGLALDRPAPGSGKASLGAELLRVHVNYLPALDRIPAGKIKGAAHITGGGLPDNLPRVLPPGCRAVIDPRAWRIPPIFELIRSGGGIAWEEMFHVFNMGIGMVLVVAAGDADAVCRLARGRVIGTIERGERGVAIDPPRAGARRLR